MLPYLGQESDSLRAQGKEGDLQRSAPIIGLEMSIFGEEGKKLAADTIRVPCVGAVGRKIRRPKTTGSTLPVVYRGIVCFALNLTLLPNPSGQMQIRSLASGQKTKESIVS